MIYLRVGREPNFELNTDLAIKMNVLLSMETTTTAIIIIRFQKKNTNMKVTTRRMSSRFASIGVLIIDNRKKDNWRENEVQHIVYEYLTNFV